MVAKGGELEGDSLQDTHLGVLMCEKGKGSTRCFIFQEGNTSDVSHLLPLVILS